MSDVQENAVDLVRQIFVSPEVTKKIVDTILPDGRKPKGWARRSGASYYREVYALQLKQVIDEMLVDRQDRIYKYDDWRHLSPQSVYLRINQSMRFLIDQLDPDGRYGRFLSMISITRERNLGIKLTFLEEFRARNTAKFAPSAVAPVVEQPKWKQKIEEWVEKSEPGDPPFILTGLMLSPDEIRTLKLEFMGLRNIMASITANAVKLIRINDTPTTPRL